MLPWRENPPERSRAFGLSGHIAERRPTLTLVKSAAMSRLFPVDPGSTQHAS
jgi:hypothetical protein